VVRPGRLKAELRIPETQAKDISPGQIVSVDTRNGVASGKVVRIAPAASQGTVLVEVALEGELPRGARPDLTVEGTIELERLDDVLFTVRPTGAQPDAQMDLYRLAPDGLNAERVKVRLGRSSVSTIEVLDGLKEGDRVILSDMSSLDYPERVRLK
jgi:HlyD family secretion protein